MEALVPPGHIGHWLWVLYLPPIVIVILSVAHSKFAERGASRRDEDD